MSGSIPSGTLEKFTTFGDLLRFLRRRAGITQMELSIAVGYSDAQISRLEQNLRMPDIPTIEARFLSALDLDDEPKAAARLLELAGNVRREDSPAPGFCPYKGLNFYDEADADLFVGREALTEIVTKHILSLAIRGKAEITRFMAIIGSSGSGKSSLARAGVVPALRWNKASSHWTIYVFTPTTHPIESLATCLTQEGGSFASTVTLMDDLRAEPRSLSLFLKRSLEGVGNSHCLILVDQFEELFTLCRSEEERSALINSLISAAKETDGPAIILITLRADFYSACAAYPELRKALAQQQEYIGAMEAEDICRAIEEPARVGRWELEPGLIDLLLRDVGNEPGALPLLSHALLETWQRRRGRTLTLSGYTSSGGVRSAIAETAETVFVDQLTHEQQTVAQRIFLRLTELGDEPGAGDTRRRAALSELIFKSDEEPTIRSVLHALADARLITISEDSADVAHEAIIREWPRLRGWLEENREGLRLHRHLTEASQEWYQSGRDPDLLYRGTKLAQASEWATTHTDELHPQEGNFLEASIALNQKETAEREAQRQRELEAAQKLAEAEKQHAKAEAKRAEEQVKAARQLRERAFFLAGAFLIALGMTFVALFLGAQARQAALAAQDQQRIAFSRELAVASISNLDIDPERSILLAIQAISATYTTDRTWTPEAEDALHRALLESRIQLTLRGHQDRVWAIVFSPDEKKIATASDDGTLKLWDAFTGKEILTIPTGATRGRHGIAFNPNGNQIATASAVGTAQVWDVETGESIITLGGHTDWVSAVAFRPDGKYLATASEDGTAKVWDLTNGKENLTLRGHSLEIWDIAFSPDGRRLATASQDGEVKVWNADTGEVQLTLSDSPSPVDSVAFSPNGKLLATAGEDRKAKLWDSTTGQELLVLPGHTGVIGDIAFSPDGRRLATAGGDGKIIVWDASTGQETFTLNGHTGPVVGVAFSPDCARFTDALPELCGTRIGSASWDGTVKVWNASFSRELESLSIPNASAGDLSPDGRILAAGFPDGSVKLWALQTSIQEASGPDVFRPPPRETLNLRAHTGVVTSIVFNSDGQQFASLGEDQIVKIWDVKTGKELEKLQGHFGGGATMDFSRDGKTFAIASDDFTMTIWNLTTHTSHSLNIFIRSTIHSIAFSPDGTQIASASDDGLAKIWEAATGKEFLTLRSHTQSVFRVTYSPDGSRLATASDDGTGKIWDAATGKVLLTLRGHVGWLNDIRFSPNGKELATAGQDSTVRIWDVGTGRELLTLRGQTEPVVLLAFSGDGRRLTTVGNDGKVQSYLLQIEDLIQLGINRLTRSFTEKECQQYLHLPEGQCLQDANPIKSSQDTSQVGLSGQSLTAGAKGKVCQVTDQAGTYDQFFNQMTYLGVQEVMKKLGWESAVLESQIPADYVRHINDFLHANCSLIVLPTGIYFMDDVQEIAKANPQQKFQIMDAFFDPPLSNTWAETFDIDQAAFLAGYAAASASRTEKVATFGGVDFPPVTDFMNGFALGVETYNQKNGSHIEVLGWDVAKQDGIFAGNFFNTDDGKRIGEMLLDQGADIIMPVAGRVGLGTAVAVKKHGNAYLIGVDTDWTITYPEYADIILTSVMKRMDVSVLSAVDAIDSGAFTGGTHSGSLENNGVSITPFNSLDKLISAKVKADLDELRTDIIAGKIKTKP